MLLQANFYCIIVWNRAECSLGIIYHKSRDHRSSLSMFETSSCATTFGAFLDFAGFFLWGFSGFVSSVSWKNDLQTYHCKRLTLVLGCLVCFSSFGLKFHFCPQVKQEKRLFITCSVVFSVEDDNSESFSSFSSVEGKMFS